MLHILSASGRFSHLKTLLDDARIVFSHPVYNVTLIGNTFHIGVMGVLSYWGAKAAEAMFHMDGTDLWIGGMLLLTGTIGILSGGALLDKLGSGIANALYVGSFADLVCGLIMAPAFLLINSFAAFLFPFFICFTCMFLQMVPLARKSIKASLFSRLQYLQCLCGLFLYI